MDSEELKKYIIIVYSVISTEAILEKLYEHMPDNGRFNEMKINDMSFISFYSYDELPEIQDSMVNLFRKVPLFFLFDISDELRGETFDLWYDTYEDKILLNFADIGDNNAVMDIQGIIELINKNGFSSLTEKQIKFIEDYSKEDNDEHK